MKEIHEFNICELVVGCKDQHEIYVARVVMNALNSNDGQSCRQWVIMHYYGATSPLVKSRRVKDITYELICRGPLY